MGDPIPAPEQSGGSSRFDKYMRHEVDDSAARRDETSEVLYDTETVVAAQLARERLEEAARQIEFEKGRAERDAVRAEDRAAAERSKPKLGIETRGQRAVREASERHQARIAAAEADPSIREADLVGQARMAANFRLKGDTIHKPEDVSARLERARKNIKDIPEE